MFFRPKRRPKPRKHDPFWGSVLRIGPPEFANWPVSDPEKWALDEPIPSLGPELAGRPVCVASHLVECWLSTHHEVARQLKHHQKKRRPNNMSGAYFATLLARSECTVDEPRTSPTQSQRTSSRSYPIILPGPGRRGAGSLLCVANTL